MLLIFSFLVYTERLRFLPNGNLCFTNMNIGIFIPLSGNRESGQTHSNNLLATADELFECIWPFCGVGAKRGNVLIVVIQANGFYCQMD